MTDQEFQVIRTELERLSTGLSKAIDQIVQQEAEINAFQSILQRKRLVSAYDLELARDEASKELHEMLQRADAGGAEGLLYPNRSNVVNMGRFHARRCRTRY